MDLQARARRAFDAVLAAANPAKAMEPHFAALSTEPTAILAVGKAAVAMAQACRDYGFDATGLIITNKENANVNNSNKEKTNTESSNIKGLEVIIGGHPVPDEGSLYSGKRAMEFVSALNAHDHLLVLLSGGGSALMAQPIGTLTLDNKRKINQALLASGLDIHRMNACRRLFSSIKGGRLARLAQPAKITQWVLSDVMGDNLESIASGPFAPDPWDFDAAVACTKEAGLDRFDFVAEALAALARGELEPPLSASDPAFAKVTSTILASNALCRKTASDYLGGVNSAQGRNIAPLPLPDLEGDAIQMGRKLADCLTSADHPIQAVTGGETVVTLPEKHGLGGRSQALALSFLLAMAERKPDYDWVLLAGGTDGRDGPTDAAGAVVTNAMQIDRRTAQNALKQFDSYHFLARIGGLLHCPPTGTNLADIVIILTAPRPQGKNHAPHKEKL